MEVSDFNYTFDELMQIVNYFLATPHIYKYCYKNSPEFRGFINSRSKDELDFYKQQHAIYKTLNRPRDYCLLHGELYRTKKKRDRLELEVLSEQIESEEFKFIFTHFDEITKQYFDKKKHGKHRMNGRKKW